MIADPRAVLETLQALPVRVECAEVRVFEVPVQPYEGGARPSSEVSVHGAGERGRGECVAWTRDAHQRFAANLEGYRYSGLLGEAPLPTDRYEAAALQSALIDLAMRQASLGWDAISGARTTTLRTWVSFDRCADPAARVQRIDPDARYKIDVDPAWSEAQFAALSRFRVGVLDFKHAPGAAICERARAHFPTAIFEDPAVASGPTARDQVVLEPVHAEVAPGEWVNLKSPRMGGWFAVLDALDRCFARGTPVYFGGMFELGVGRVQARLMAAAFAPVARHDLASIPERETDTRRPARVDPSAVGFGS